MNESKSRIWIALVRVLAGAIFIRSALPKMNAAYLLGFDRQISAWSAGNPFPWFKWFLQTFASSNEQVFAIAVMVLEMLVGVALVLGFLTGLASLVGMLLTALALLAASHLGAQTGAIGWALAPNAFAILLLGLLFILRAGRYYGMDSRMGPSRSLFW